MHNFLHRFFNPHCEQCKLEEQEKQICNSCTVLQQQLERANYEKDLLLQQLFAKPVETSRSTTAEEMEAIRPAKHIPFSVRKRELEENDRAEAKRRIAFDDSQKGAVKTTIESLETEIIGDDKETVNGN